MRNLAKCLAIVAIGLVTSGGVGAQNGPAPAPPGPGAMRPFVSLSLPRKPLFFGMVSGLGPRKLQATTTAHVVANRPFQLVASFQELNLGQTAIPGQETKVRINGQDVTVGTEYVTIAAGGPTLMNGVDVPIVIEVAVKTPTLYPAGRYSGKLALGVR